MSNKVLEKIVEDYVKLRLPVSSFVWQGGEPTLMGINFFEKAVELQRRFGKGGQVVSNSLQTNGILLNEDWCRFLRANKFLVGISCDGPEQINDYYRRDHSESGSFELIMSAIENCKKHNVKFNVLVVVNNRNVESPDELFDFFVKLKIKYLQFIPCVERNANSAEIKDFSVSPQKYGVFLCRVFDCWHKHGPAKLGIQNYDSILNYYVTGAHGSCTFNKRCSDYIVIEHNGNTFCCDFFVEQRWRLGNIFDESIGVLANNDKKKEFSRLKGKLCSRCLTCRYLTLCRGGCLKDRIAGGKGSFQGQSYLCDAYKRFFEHSLGRFMEIAACLSSH